MKILRLKLPAIKNTRSLRNDEKENSFMKLTHKEKSLNLIKIPKNVRTINYNNYLSHRSNISKVETSHEKNDSIKSFIFKNISLNQNLNLKFDLKKISTTKNFKNIQTFSTDKDREKIFNRKNKNKTNDMNLFLLKLDKIFGIKNGIKRINNISKQLLKDDENQTNGNKLYNDKEEEKKESMTFFVDKNNMKTMLKKSLTKKINLKKSILKIKSKVFDNYHVKSMSFTPFRYNNIRKIKYFENMAREKINHNTNDTPKVISYSFKNESKGEKFKYILRKKLKNLGNEMIENKNYMKDINKQIQSCLRRARSKLENFANNIEKENSNNIIYNIIKN